jgi:hypothetical protein
MAAKTREQEELDQMRRETSDAYRLAEELGNTREQLRKAQEELRTESAKGMARSIMGSLTWLILTCALVAGVGYPLWKVMSTKAVVSRCVVERKSEGGLTGYKLSGYIEWGSNLDYGIYSTLDETLQAGVKLACPSIQQPEKK